MNKNKIIIISIAVLIVIAGGFFYSGILYEKNTNRQNSGFNRTQQNMPQNLNGGIKNNNLNIGEIILKDQESITVKLMNGSSKLIFISDSTQVSKNTNINIEELEIGQNVSIQGTENSDNSLTAKSIQVMSGSQNKMNMLK